MTSTTAAAAGLLGGRGTHDHTRCDHLPPNTNTPIQAGKLSEAVELLMGVEKQARMGNDVPSLKEVVLFAVKLVRCVFAWVGLRLNRMSDPWVFGWVGG